MNNDKSNVTFGHPKDGGAVFWAPEGATLPTSADDPLDPTVFTCLGYVTEDGITWTTEEEGDDVKAWGPETVMHSQTGYTKTANLNLMEAYKPAVLQFLYGRENVTINDDGSMKWVDTGEALPRGVLVVDTIKSNGSTNPQVHRKVFGDCQFTDRSGDHVYNNADPLSYPIKLTAYKFTYEGKTDYEVNFLSAPTPVSA